jgi:hypothetical protein
VSFLFVPFFSSVKRKKEPKKEKHMGEKQIMCKKALSSLSFSFCAVFSSLSKEKKRQKKN